MPQITIEHAMQMALQHHLANSFSQAENLYRQVLSLNPTHARALHLLGTLLGQTGRRAAAIECLQAAISANPSDAEAYFNLGVALNDEGRRGQAIDAYRNALACRADYSNALQNLGVALLAEGEMDNAIAMFTRTLGLKPDQPASYLSLGIALLKRGDLDDAIAAEKQALQLQPGNAQAFNVLGGALLRKGQLAEAEEACRAAIGLKSDYSDAHCTLGNILTETRRFDEALASYQQALTHDPSHYSACLNLGYCLTKTGRHREACATALRAIEIAPNLADPHYNLGNACKDLGDLVQATAAYRRALEIDPKSVDAHWNLAVVLLLQGDFERGWVEHEWRWQVRDSDSHRRDFVQPQWDGADLHGKTILLHTEQGFGDAIQFIRYAPLVAARGGRVIVRCSPAVARLFATIPGIDQLVIAEPIPAFDVHCPLMSLPLAFATRLETIPAEVPYLKVDAALAERWAKRINSGPLGLKVGLAWAGRPTKRNDAARSLSLSQLAPLQKVSGVTFYSLQKDKPPAPEAFLRVIHCSDGLRDFADTAALISELDLVISVDTAVAHLAGALGIPVWLLLPFIPDWRWMMNRQDSPWYPTMRLFRQKRDGDWAEVIERLADELVKWHGRPAAVFAAEAWAGRACDDESEITSGQVVGSAPRTEFSSASATVRGADPTRIGHAHSDEAAAFNNRGADLAERGDLGGAMAAYRQAIELRPQYAAPHVNLAHLLLLRGDFEKGLAEYEWRFKTPGFPTTHHDLPQPRWDGSDLYGKSLLICAEQGYGDLLQFIRYAPLIMQRGGRVMLQSLPEMSRLLECVSGLEQVFPGPLSRFDVRCPLLSLPLAFATRLESIPRNVPYLQPDPALVEVWRKKLGPSKNQVRVGIAWAGDSTHPNNRTRSISLSQLAPFAETSGMIFYSLQKGTPARESDSPPVNLRLIDFTKDLHDFADTAAFIANLDLVIAVDTAVVHLAGAMGRPAWVLLAYTPDWRWLLDRDDSPWYPTVRLFRQKTPGDWADVIERVGFSLNDLARFL